jgi:hypothetical protein
MQDFLEEALFLLNKICNINIVFLTFAMKAKSTDIDSYFWLGKSIQIEMTNLISQKIADTHNPEKHIKQSTE